MRVATIRQSVARGIRYGAFLLVGTLAAGSADAASRLHIGGQVDTDTWAQKGPLEVSVQIENRQAPLYQASWRQDRWYVEAREGARYQVRVHNTSGERVAFVISVDGINAINGQRSALTSTEPMYVLDPYQTTTIKGWRRSLSKVARFVFVDEERSYAERTNQANGDLGWIRVAAFREQVYYTYRKDEGQVRDRAGERGPAPQSSRGVDPQASRGDVGSPKEQSNPGTGWGETEKDKVREVQFNPEQVACAQVIVRYEYHSGLVSLGILPIQRWHDRTLERDNGEYGFALPPPR